MKLKTRTIAAPTFESDFSMVGKKTFWKHILPESVVHYTDGSGKRQTVNFDRGYLTDLVDTFKAKGLDETPFQLADKDNRHTMDPERRRGEVTDMRLASDGESPGLWAKVECPTAKAAKAIIHNPKLGVSARIREGIETSDGRVFKRGIIHVLGTLDPQVTGLESWQAVDLSNEANVLDLSNASYEVATMAKKVTYKADVSDYTEADIDAMTDDEIVAFNEHFEIEMPSDEELATLMAELEADPEEDDGPDSEVVDDARKDELVDTKLSKKAQRDIELANSSAALANDRVRKVEKELADAKWATKRADYLRLGVPAHLLDLATPIMARADVVEIDLSNSEEDDINVTEIVTAMLDAQKGLIDINLSNGFVDASGKDDEDQAVLDAWERQSPVRGVHS